MRKFLPAAAMLLCLILSTHAFSQTSNATLGGTVSDASGALIPGVTITAANVGTGIMTTVISNEAGAYQFASLQTGTYRLSAELRGLQTQTYSNVVLGVSQQVRLNFTLQVGGVAQAVTKAQRKAGSKGNHPVCAQLRSLRGIFINGRGHPS